MRPGNVNAFRVGNAGCIQIQTAEQERNQHGIQEITAFFLSYRKADHTDIIGKLQNIIEIFLIRPGLRHNLRRVVFPDGIGKMQGQVLLRSAGVFGKHGRKKCGGICYNHGLFRQKRCHFFIKSNLILFVFCHGLN